MRAIVSPSNAMTGISTSNIGIHIQLTASRAPAVRAHEDRQQNPIGPLKEEVGEQCKDQQAYEGSVAQSVGASRRATREPQGRLGLWESARDQRADQHRSAPRRRT